MITTVAVETLCDQQLAAEYNDVARYPYKLLNGDLRYDYDDRPAEYTVGKGHYKFFSDKLRWVFYRYQALFEECKRREIDVEYNWPTEGSLFLSAWNDWIPSPLALRVSRARIRDRMPAKAIWSNS